MEREGVRLSGTAVDPASGNHHLAGNPGGTDSVRGRRSILNFVESVKIVKVGIQEPIQVFCLWQTFQTFFT